MWEWRRSRINRAAHDLPPGWAGRPHSNRHSLPQRPSPAQPGGGRHTYIAKRGGRACGATNKRRNDHALSDAVNDGEKWPLACRFGAGGGTRTPNLLFTRQPRTVQPVLTGAGLCCPCSSPRVRRPASTFLIGRVALGGITGRMTCQPLFPLNGVQVLDVVDNPPVSPAPPALVRGP
jgi:hypothetical protein